MVKAWLECANFRKVARKFGIPHTAQAKYIIVKELKSMLGSVLENARHLANGEKKME